MRTYEVTITGKMPLLHHADNIEWADRMERWKDDAANRKKSKKGDDRSPAFRWLGSLYHDDNVITIPQDNLMRCFMEGGALVPVPGGRSGKTFKAQSQSGMLVEGFHWPLLIDGQPIPVAPIKELEKEPDFDAHKALVESSGFRLFVKRAKVGANKHVRVRPMFERWSVVGNVIVQDDQITRDILAEMVIQAGLYKGLGDWRPGGRTPGAFGTFSAAVR